MRVIFAQNALGRCAGRIVVHRNPRLPQGERDIGLRHSEDGTVGVGFVLDQDVEERVH